MSNTIFRIFPKHHYPTYSDEKIIEAVDTLKIYSKEEITFTNYGSVQFIDCGQGLEHIFCPWCGRELDIKFWKEAMDKAYNNGSFGYLGIRMPCCNLPSSLEELIYVKPCGFAAFVIEVHDPEIIPCAAELHEMGKCFGNINFFRMISAHI